MYAALKSEFRKLMTVRSTLVITAISFLISVGLIGFWIFGYKNVGGTEVSTGALVDGLTTAITFLGTIYSFIAILLVGHEYRYNTIMYSLTSSNSRTKVYLAKYLASVVFSIISVAILLLLLVLAFLVGQKIAGINTLPQHIPMWSIVWRMLLYIGGSLTFAFTFTVLLRSLIGAIALILIVPTTIEGILTFVLKTKAQYLPFSSLTNITATAHQEGINVKGCAIAFVAYVIVLGVGSYVMFLKRDAN